ncbi:uncharacterized protein LOC107768984 [Nicotiana tabacum]|uniref:Uncharacterized protein LOC107768984 n=1 Tax=Nicotiana tabacum TaxID=4097 RepID=A0A1S3XUU1_TOBAC|nr:PREDICTED: uncharacterized protein LOC107768984 [Nicotiana tabacum]
MARTLVLLENKFTSLSQLIASHSRKWKRKWRACYGYGDEHDPVIQLNNEEIDQSYYFGEVDPNTCSGEVSAIWKKNIIMGGKCQLPEFSGVIIYDTAGNLVNPKNPRPLALPWKE